jgi:flagellar motor switch protein FliN/FliY
MERGAEPKLGDEISADELAALGFTPPAAPVDAMLVGAATGAPATETGSSQGSPTPPAAVAPAASPGSGGGGEGSPLPELTAQDDVAADAGIGLLMDVPLRVSIELGRISMTLQEVLSLGRGSIVELERLAGEPVDILVNDKIIGRGEVVVIDEYFGVKITELIDPKG